jgi:hypothetical protein
MPCRLRVLFIGRVLWIDIRLGLLTVPEPVIAVTGIRGHGLELDRYYYDDWT